MCAWKKTAFMRRRAQRSARRRGQRSRPGLAGLEFAEGIPGSVGGGVRMNAGAYGGEMSGVVERVRVLQKNGEVIWLDKTQMDFGYRHSAVEQSGAVVLEAVFALQPDDREAIAVRMNDYAARRREKQPLTYPSAAAFSSGRRGILRESSSRMRAEGRKRRRRTGLRKARGLPHQHGKRFRGRLFAAERFGAAHCL